MMNAPADVTEALAAELLVCKTCGFERSESNEFDGDMHAALCNRLDEVRLRDYFEGDISRRVT